MTDNNIITSKSPRPKLKKGDLSNPQNQKQIRSEWSEKVAKCSILFEPEKPYFAHAAFVFRENNNNKLMHWNNSTPA